ncbi:glutamate--tRNA ligase [Helicobacter sp. 13S00401-1]|uniref:glutamate--tRNA ligase n=1 Tax=Helicobacter sp. 13S00401-1 TaxID=1905758 RepID=UPI000BA6B1AB|nr:glutamate--tRNA ligase [Helicobacter sp. 13S00401-1]PAF51842.1 glutamate--tRNA ligase [Helicobacter sp. 13S00401-1]
MFMIITRFAPSPTGNLHIGGLRTALYCYLYARKNHGKFLLRIEDTDTERNSQEALDSILEAFKWVELEHDSPMWFQSKRLEIYKSYIQKLLDSNKAYYCYLSKEELENERQKTKNLKDFTRKYRDFTGTPPSGVQPVVRLKAPLSGNVEFIDGIKGKITINASELDDFVIARSDGTPTYNFVVTIDDALSEISDVIRGDDHVSNTPKQILIYNALGFKVPKFYHVPMICNEAGAKLSKRDGALSVLEYRDAGILKEALLNFLFRLGFSHGDQEIFSMEEMLEVFDPSEINNSASACNFSKLMWLNAHYIKQKSTKELLSLLKLDLKDSAQTECLFEALKSRANTLNDFKLGIETILEKPNYDEKMDSKVSPLALKDLSLVEGFNFESLESIKDALHNLKLDYKIGLFMQALRCALLGKPGGIDLGECLFILGRDESLNRIKTYLETKNI